MKTFKKYGSEIWKIIAKFGCPPRFIAMVRRFHDGMQALVQNGGDRAFSDHFGIFLVTVKLGKKCVILHGKKYDNFGKISAIFSKIGKVYLLNWDFSANWECSRSIGNFFSQLGKNLVLETGPSFV